MPTNIIQAIDQKLYPTITMWNRLEGRPRTHNFNKALKSEVRDALWMICKQWQMGEFKGEDAGTAVFSKIKIDSTEIIEFSPANSPFTKLDKSLPIETIIEQRSINFERDTQNIGLDIRLQLGNYWYKLLKRESLGSYYSQYVDLYGFKLGAKDRATDQIFAHKEELQQWMAISGRTIDGFEIIKHIDNGNEASSGIILSDTDHKPILNEIGQKLIKYYRQNFTQPSTQDDNSWQPDRLEYKAAAKASNSESVDTLVAEEYYHGHLDWYAFNLESDNGDGSIKPKTFKDTFIPSPIEFDGMPDKRWWKFEDSKTFFGNVTPSTTDLSKLLLIEFGLTYANDWFIVPFNLPIGSIADVKGITVTNNFGDLYWIEPTEKIGENSTEWSVFRQQSNPVNKKLFLSPSAIKVQEGSPLEEVMLIRDEMANMVWGVEKTIPSTRGIGVQGSEYAIQRRSFHENYTDKVALTDYNASVYYKAMSDVPENWIPYIPVHVDGHNRKIQLKRSSMIRALDGDALPPQKIMPLTTILSESDLIHEEEVTRVGTRVIQSFQRTRWLNGEIYLWLGTKKKTGRGEGSSGLAFDQLIAP